MEEKIAEIFGLDLNDPETKASWDECAEMMEQFRQARAVLEQYRQSLLFELVALQEGACHSRLVKIPANAKKTRSGYFIETRGYRRPKKRSSRGIKVQEKRKALGLNVWGKYSEGVYASLSRKEAYARALRTERVLLLCQVCDTWFMKRVRIVLVDYWYTLKEPITCTRCGTVHEAGIKLWWKWKEQ